MRILIKIRINLIRIWRLLRARLTLFLKWEFNSIYDNSILSAHLPEKNKIIPRGLGDENPIMHDEK